MRIKEITLKELSKEGDKEDPNLVAVLCHMGEGICYHNIHILNHVNNCNYEKITMHKKGNFSSLKN